MSISPHSQKLIIGLPGRGLQYAALAASFSEHFFLADSRDQVPVYVIGESFRAPNEQMKARDCHFTYIFHYIASSGSFTIHIQGLRVLLVFDVANQSDCRLRHRQELSLNRDEMIKSAFSLSPLNTYILSTSK